ncbi:LuxR family transcriptional regulator [Cellulomonas terrae]|uniref:LuxR family transcriptional regulator n=2 Tax=Cellulomonas terrae TaxID=311234 RepID=A0A511JID0_9CELL|nr:LuxR family transcriptional regulator [Cellulomonas terrae]
MAARSASGPITVMIVDDHEVVRRGVAEIVDRAEGMTVVAEAGSVADGLQRADLVRPSVVLVDLQLPDGTGIDVMRALRERLPESRAIVLTSFDDAGALEAALDEGAAAYLLKSARGAEIVDAIRAVAAGRVLLDQRAVSRHKDRQEDPTGTLTPSELRVVELIGEGLSNREIAERLGIVEKTVKNHITSVLAKMGLQRRTQVAAWVASRARAGWQVDAGG